MLQCWHEDPKCRPSFDLIQQNIRQMLRNEPTSAKSNESLEEKDYDVIISAEASEVHSVQDTSSYCTKKPFTTQLSLPGNCYENNSFF